MQIHKLQQTISLDSVVDRVLHKYVISSTQPSPKTIEKIKTIVKTVFSQTLDSSFITDRYATLTNYITQLDELRKIPIIPQRSQEWFDTRATMISASDVGQAIGKGKFGNVSDFYKKKALYETIPFDSSMPPLRHGVMFEPIASSIYEKRNSTKVYDFGIIKHPTHSFLGASPDGITELGIMLEIKCPWRRKIDGTIPEQYMYQVQYQLDVCNLKECDYSEFGFVQFESYDEFTAKRHEIDTETGIIGEYKESGEFKYYYGEVSGSDEYYTEWMKEHEGKCDRMHFWKLDKYNCIRIYRDDQLIQDTTVLLQDIWNKVLAYRNDRELYELEINTKKKRVYKKKASEDACMFVQDLELGA